MTDAPHENNEQAACPQQMLWSESYWPLQYGLSAAQILLIIPGLIIPGLIFLRGALVLRRVRSLSTAEQERRAVSSRGVSG